MLNTTGRDREAIEAYRQSVSSLRSLSDPLPADRDLLSKLAAAEHNLARGVQKENPHEAEAMLRRVGNSLRRFLGGDPANPEYRSQLAACQNSLGVLFDNLGRSLESEASYRSALKLYDQLAHDFPEIVDYQRRLAFTFNNLGIILRTRTDKFKESEQARAGRSRSNRSWRLPIPRCPVIRATSAAVCKTWRSF